MKEETQDVDIDIERNISSYQPWIYFLTQKFNKYAIPLRFERGHGVVYDVFF